MSEVVRTDYVWTQLGSCRRERIPTYVFFTDGLERLAKDLCDGCPVLLRCREEALRTQSQGVWGGMTLSERRKWSRARVAAGAVS